MIPRCDHSAISLSPGLLLRGLLLLLFGLSPFFMSAQGTLLEGVVSRVEGIGAMSFVRIMLINNDGDMQGTISDWEGHYEFEDLDPGHYQMVVMPFSEKPDTNWIEVSRWGYDVLNIYYSDPCQYDPKAEVCPVCQKSNRIIPVHYGEYTNKVSRKVRRDKLAIGEDERAPCAPSWYCKRDDIKF